MLLVIQIIAIISGIALITAVVMQTTKADGFSAAMGGAADSSKFRKGSREDMLEKITKVAAVVWIFSMFIGAIFWYNSR